MSKRPSDICLWRDLIILKLLNQYSISTTLIVVAKF